MRGVGDILYTAYNIYIVYVPYLYLISLLSLPIMFAFFHFCILICSFYHTNNFLLPYLLFVISLHLSEPDL